MKNHSHHQATFTCLILCLFLFSNCAQITSFQTAKTIPKDEGEITVSLGAFGIRDQFDGGGAVGAVNLEFMGRTGVGEKSDIGLHISSFSTIVFDYKYQFVGDRYSKFAMATGPGVGFSAFGFGAVIGQFQLPLHMSAHPSKQFGLYFTPKYINQFIIGGGEDGFIHYAGGSIGIEAGRRTKFGADISCASVINQNEEFDLNNLGLGLFHIGIGVKFHIGGQDR
jgi:hypothetical protein